MLDASRLHLELVMLDDWSAGIMEIQVQVQQLKLPLTDIVEVQVQEQMKVTSLAKTTASAVSEGLPTVGAAGRW